MSAVVMAVIARCGLQGSGSLTGIVQTEDGLAVPPADADQHWIW